MIAQPNRRYMWSGRGNYAHTLLEMMIAMNLLVVVATSITLAWRASTKAGVMAGQLMYEAREAMTRVRWTQDVRTSVPLIGEPGRLRGDNMHLEMWHNLSMDPVPRMTSVSWTIGQAGEVWRSQTDAIDAHVVRRRHSLSFNSPQFRYGWMTRTGWRWSKNVFPEEGNPQVVELYDSSRINPQDHRWREVLRY